MITYFNLSRPDSERLMGDGSKRAPESKAQIEITPCPITSEHINGRRRISPLFLEVKHNSRDEMIIWSWGINGTVVHERLLEEFGQQGFTGYQTKPATVRFRDGVISTEYREFVVAGWAGMASPESGIRLVNSCPACHFTRYSGITNRDLLIDWNQWTGDDFFIVWPMPLFWLISERVAKWLQHHKVKSFSLRRLEDPSSRIGQRGFGPGRLSDYLPENLAIKYGRPFGLE